MNMSSGSCGVIWGLRAILLSVVITVSGFAGERRDEVTTARNLVSEALHRRIYGLESEHTSLLAMAIKTSPEFAPAYWHQGHVNYKNRWLKVDDLTTDTDLSKRLGRYEDNRAKVPPTVNGYLALANWCAENSLPMQERAHLFQVIGLAPNHALARQRLGFVLVNGDWLDVQTIWTGMYDARQTQAALAKWQQPLAAIGKGLKRRGEKQREAAREKLAEITDPQAICGLEQLANSNSDSSLPVIEVLSGMQQHEASAALARQANFSPWPQAREAAARQLGTRPFDHYVPQLIAEMASPIQSRIDTAATRGQVLYRHVFFREAQHQNQVLVLDTRYRRVVTLRLRAESAVGDDDSDGGGDSGPSFGEVVMADLQDTVQTREQQRRLQNAWTDAMNNRICHVLRTATGQQLPSKPQSWWDWWDQQSQVTRPGQKTAQTKTQQETKTFVQSSDGTVPNVVQQPPRRTHECFAAGTLVVTASGPLEIERVLVGDLVLAKHPDTGELSFRPVLATTIRPPEQVVKIQTAIETIEATAGHPLWVDGEGWRMASDLKSGMALHGVDHAVQITDVKSGQMKQTYNLIVDGFHSYFVGFNRVLAHDNTPCRPTNSVVPGLARLAN